MLSVRNREGAVKAFIPKPLYLAVVRLQASEGLDWEEACIRAADLINANSVEFKRRVQLEAQRLYKQRFMRELNKARETITKEAWEAGANWVRMNEDNFRVPCGICRKPMYFSSLDGNWESEIKPTLYQAFKNWHHTKCAP
jgi:hypothetical protein